MADSLKRVQWAKELETQDRCHFYLFQKAFMVMADAEAPADQKELAARVYNKTVNLFAVAMICTTNSVAGAAIDADNAVLEETLEWIIITDQWANMAASGV